MTFHSSSSRNDKPVEYSVASYIIEYLKTRFHTEAPHISVLAPDRSIILGMKAFRQEPSIEENIEEDEIDEILLEERFDPLWIRGHSTHGVQAVLRDIMVGLFNQLSIACKNFFNSIRKSIIDSVLINYA